jgi:hypothetical protein
MRPLWPALIPLACVACDGATGPDLVPCTDPLTVTITAHTARPTFSWAPNCLIDQISVEEVLPPSVGGNQMTWILTARAPGLGVGAPLQYGAVPFRMQEFLHAADLSFQYTYLVRVYGAGTMLGETSFSPPFPPD